MRKVRVVTHNGAAHRDDFMSCCAVLYHEFSTNNSTPNVERRLVLPSDLIARNTYVIDTGGHWDPDFLNFDHHQQDSRVSEKCALDLVLDYIMGSDIYRGFARSNDWLRLTTVQDTRGVAEAATHVGATAKSFAAMRSPIEKCMLLWFSDAHTVHGDSALHHAMREIGRVLLSSSEDINAQQEALRRIPAPVEWEGLKIWDIRPAWDSDERNSFAVVNEMASRLSVDVVVGHNLRHSKVGLYRQEWSSAKLDLSLLAAHPKFHSAHQNGFYAVVSSDVQDFELLEMLAMARTNQEPA